MRRRDFLALVGGAAAAPAILRPLAAHAQHPMPVIGALYSGTPAGYWLPRDAAFLRALNDAGYADGRNLRIEARWADDHYDRLPALAADLIQHNVAVIAAFTTPSARAAKAATTKIPIVFTSIANPVQMGFVASLNRPGGNLTGVTLLSVELGAKLLELLHEVVPSAATVALLVNPKNPNAETQSRDAQAAARDLGLKLHVLDASSEADFAPVFTNLHDLGANALMIGQDAFFDSQMNRLATLSLDQAMPAIFANRDFPNAGGLMSYGTTELEAYRQVGLYVVRILKGEKPADLPVLEPTKFELVLNLKTAKTLGLTVPPELLATADQVIE